MESNRDESLKCFLLAEKYFNEGEPERAKRFASKSEKLFPNDKAKSKINFKYEEELGNLDVHVVSLRSFIPSI